ncbi:MAG: biotin/lipoyl-binding protein, partial [Planctomycetota bacterium]|nr:biotin/lipoyl-binding protein [Planctomycetota bacterium]
MEVARVEKRPVERSIDGYGTLRGWETVTIGAKGSGRVVKVRHDIGDRVAPGELLVELDSTDADLAVREAERRLEAELTKLNLKELPNSEFDELSVPSVVQAKVSLDRSKNNLARERSLIQRGAGTAQDFQNAENDVQAAEAVLNNAVLNVRSIRASALTNQVLLDVMRAKRRDIEIRVPVPSAAPQGA